MHLCPWLIDKQNLCSCPTYSEWDILYGPYGWIWQRIANQSYGTFLKSLDWFEISTPAVLKCSYGEQIHFFKTVERSVTQCKY